MAVDTKKVLDAVQSVGSIVSLVLPAVGEGIVLVTGIIKEVKSLTNSEGTVEYTVVLAEGKAQLGASIQVSQDDLAAINAELVKMGKPPLSA